MNKWYLGIDIAKAKFDAALLNEHKECIKHEVFEQNYEGFHGLLKMVRGHCENREQVWVGMESSGHYHYNLFEFLKEKLTPNITILNPSLIAKYCKMTLRPCKTDKKDACKIAQYLIETEVNPTVLDKVLQQLSYYDKEREHYVTKLAECKVRIRTWLALGFPELERQIGSLSSRYLIDFLEEFPSAASISAMSQRDFIEKFHEILPAKTKNMKLRPEEIYSLAKQSIGREIEGYRKLFRSTIEIMHSLKKTIQTLEEEQEQLCTKHYSLQRVIVQSIPGMGPVSAISILSHLPVVENFENYRKLIAFVGTDPVIRESGMYRGRGRISKKGNPHLRRRLYLCAMRVIQKDGIFKDYYQRLREKGKPAKVALIAVANRLLKILYALLSKGEMFDADYHQQFITRDQSIVENTRQSVEKAHNISNSKSTTSCRSTV